MLGMQQTQPYGLYSRAGVEKCLYYYPLKRIHLAKEGQCAPDRYNELWRYGAAVKDEEEQIKAEKMLEGIAEWITQRL